AAPRQRNEAAQTVPPGLFLPTKRPHLDQLVIRVDGDCVSYELPALPPEGVDELGRIILLLHHPLEAQLLGECLVGLFLRPLFPVMPLDAATQTSPQFTIFPLGRRFFLLFRRFLLLLRTSQTGSRS